MLKRLPLWILTFLASAVLGASFLLIGARWFSILFSAVGQWQRPDIAQVQVVRLEKDPFDPVGMKVHVLRAGRMTELRMLQEEARELAPGDHPWILDNLYASPRRPAQYRFGVRRLLGEWPEPLLVLSFWALAGPLRRRWKALLVPVEPDRPRRVVTDDFHLRAERHKGEPH